MSQVSQKTAEELQGAISKLEVDLVGVASVAELSQPWLRDQVLALLPQARSVVCFGMEIYPEVLDHGKPEKLMGEGSARELLEPHGEYLTGRLNKAAYDLARACRSRGFRTLPMPASKYPTDQRYLRAILSYKHVAEAAGMGTIGRHSLLISPQHGPRVRLSCVLTEFEFSPSPRLSKDLCDGCNECLVACPAGALSEPKSGDAYAINKFACRAFRSASGDCTECMRVCPMGR